MRKSTTDGMAVTYSLREGDGYTECGKQVMVAGLPPCPGATVPAGEPFFFDRVGQLTGEMFLTRCCCCVQTDNTRAELDSTGQPINDLTCTPYCCVTY